MYRIWDRKVLGIVPCRFSSVDRMEVEVHYPFVGLLGAEGKSRFYRRLCRLMRSFELQSMDGFELARRDRILLAVPAVILTWGFEYFHWEGFDRIEVHPLSYFSKVTGGYHYGEADPRNRTIRVSWKRVKEGMDNPDDAIHLLYHEYAHALVLSRQRGKHREDERFIQELKEFNARHYFDERVRRSPLIRPYAFTNGMEFFAVLVEVLMERADELKLRHGPLYVDLLWLLQLNPHESLVEQQSTWFR